jgi:hypothetical protein
VKVASTFRPFEDDIGLVFTTFWCRYICAYMHACVCVDGDPDLGTYVFGNDKFKSKKQNWFSTGTTAAFIPVDRIHNVTGGIKISNKKRQFFRRKLTKIAENCDHSIDPWMWLQNRFLSFKNP